jgi:uncharacterized protein (TIGR03435 family)
VRIEIRMIPALLVLCGLAAGQETFDAASVKRSSGSVDTRGPVVVIGGCIGGPGTRTPITLTCQSISLGGLISRAYGLEVVGPGWLDEEKFDIVARVPAGATKQQLLVMEQNLLAERFRLVAHRGEREASGYELVVRSSGAKLKPSDPQSNVTPHMSGREFGKGVQIQLFNEPIDIVVQMVKMLHQTAAVKDSTGLTGRYDFTLTYVPPERLAAAAMDGAGGGPSNPSDLAQSEEPAGPTVLEALQDQLGLDVKKGKVSLPVLFVDSALRLPTPN